MKVRFLIVTILLYFSTSVFCQLNTKRENGLSIGLSFSPDYSFRTLTSDATSSSNLIVESRDTSKKPCFGFTTGFNLAFILNRKWALEGGLQYSEKGENTNWHNYIWFPPGPNWPIAGSEANRYIYIDVPIRINYYLYSKRFKLYVIGGVAPNIFLTYKSTFTSLFSDNQKESSTSYSRDNFNGINLSLMAGLGASYDFSDRFYVKMEPTYRRFLNSITNTPVKSFLFSFGLNTGIYYKL